MSHFTDLSPEVVAAGLLLEAEGEVSVVVLCPNDERLLLFLVDSVTQDFGLQQQGAWVG